MFLYVPLAAALRNSEFLPRTACNVFCMIQQTTNIIFLRNTDWFVFTVETFRALCV